MASNQQLLKEFRIMLSESGIDDSPIIDDLLLCFLRYRNGDVKQAFDALKSYIQCKESYPELMTNLREICKERLVDSVFNRMSPKRDRLGRYIYLVPIGRWRDDLCSLEDVFRVCIHDLHTVVCDTTTQSAGGVCVIDFKNFGVKKMKDMTPNYLKILINIMQGTFPMKIKGVHILNHSWLVNVILTMAWPFLSNKLRGRIHLHKDYSSLCELIDPSCLPCDYGGQLGALSEMGTVLDVVQPKTNLFACLAKVKLT